MTIDFPESMGAAAFESTMAHQRTEKVTNVMNLRGPDSGLEFMGWFYRYDGNHPLDWSWEYWSCEWAPGWTGGDSCLEAGA